MDGNHFGYDLLFARGQFFGDGCEAGFEVGVFGLSGEGLGPIEAEVEMAAAVVDAGAYFASG